MISSLAGRVASPRLPEGEVRVGGFGGPEALARWLLDNDIAAVVDATHPFAERISSSAAIACERAEVPLLRLERPGWSAGPGDDWHWVDDTARRAAAIAGARRARLPDDRTAGPGRVRRRSRRGSSCAASTRPSRRCPRGTSCVLDRGPFTLAGELALIDRHRIDLVVTKDSGGSLTEAKLDAARSRRLPVIVIRRPPRPDAPTVEDVPAALAWLHA